MKVTGYFQSMGYFHQAAESSLILPLLIVWPSFFNMGEPWKLCKPKLEEERSL
jgi:hypothetical protein